MLDHWNAIFTPTWFHNHNLWISFFFHFIGLFFQKTKTKNRLTPFYYIRTIRTKRARAINNMLIMFLIYFNIQQWPLFNRIYLLRWWIKVKRQTNDGNGMNQWRLYALKRSVGQFTHERVNMMQIRLIFCFSEFPSESFPREIINSIRIRMMVLSMNI